MKLKRVNFPPLLLILSMLISACSTFKSSPSKGEKLLTESSTNAQVNMGEQQQEYTVPELPVLDEKEYADELNVSEFERKITEKVDEALQSNKQKNINQLSDELFFKAYDTAIRGHSKLAVIIYKHILRLKSEDDYIKEKYAIELVKESNLVEASAIFEELFAKKDIAKKNQKVGLILGGIYTTFGNTKSAKKTYKQILKYHDDSEEACIFLAKIYALERSFTKANRLLNKCERKIKNRGVFSYYRGKIAVERKKNRLAIKYFKRALAVDPSYYQAAIALGLMYEHKGKIKRALRVYKRFVEKNPMNYAILMRLVELIFEKGDSKEVIPYLERISTIDPSDLNVKVKLGVLYTDIGEYEKSKMIFEEILKEVPDSDKVIYYLGTLYQRTKYPEKAIKLLGKVSPVSPLYLDSNIRISQMLQTLAVQDYKGSGNSSNVERFKTFVDLKTIEIPAVRIELKVVLTGFYESVGVYSKAIETLLQVRGEKSFNEDHEYYLASLYQKNENYEQAFELVREMLRKNPDNPDVLNFLGYSIIEKQGELDEAYKYISRALKLKPDDGYIRDSLGWYYYKVGNFKKALREVKKALQLVKNDAVIIKHLGMIYQSMKKYSKAEKYYVEALKNCKEEEEKKDILKALKGLQLERLPAATQK